MEGAGGLGWRGRGARVSDFFPTNPNLKKNGGGGRSCGK